LPGDAALVLIPGTKSTIADLLSFRTNGWDIDLAAHVRRGGHVLGICGGYQMLGQEVSDPEGIEGSADCVAGLGLLDVVTVMRPEKHLSLTSAIVKKNGKAVNGYEIHIGETTGPDCDHAWLEIAGIAHGAASADGRILGCYLHGIFSEDNFRRIFLKNLGADVSSLNYKSSVENTLDTLADHLEAHLDIENLMGFAEKV